MSGFSTTAVGQEGEQRAVQTLEGLGFDVIGRNVDTGRGEIDIVAWEGKTLCFIEVKARSVEDFGGGRAAVDRTKQARLWKAAEAYLAKNPDLWQDPPECRFDVVSVSVNRDVPLAEWPCELLRNAFER